jgi:hypothetical protein
MNDLTRSDAKERELWKRIRHRAADRTVSPCPESHDWAAYLAGMLSRKRRSCLEDHLFSCSECLNAVAEIRRLSKEKPAEAPDGVIARAKRLVVLPPQRDEGVSEFLVWREAPLWHRWVRVAAAALVLLSAAGGWRLGQVFRHDQRRLVASMVSVISFGVSDYLGLGNPLEGLGGFSQENDHEK